MHELNYLFKLRNHKYCKWHHENVAVACVSAGEVHTPPGDPQDKLHLLKTIKNIKRKHQEPF